MIIATVSLLQIWENKNKNLLLIEEYINEAYAQNIIFQKQVFLTC